MFPFASVARRKMDEARELNCNRLGSCEVCGSSYALYTCPRCELKTCSLNCVSIHKKELECNGERDKTGYIPLSKFSNLTLLSDYRFLEEISRTIDNCKRNPFKKYTRFNRPLPPHLWRLRSVALRRKTTLHFLPKHFTRHKDNTTLLNFKTGTIHWRLELVFPQGDHVKIALEQCSENDRLSLLLSQLLDFEKCPDLYRHHLKFYHAAGLAGIEVLLKAENIKSHDSFFLLDLSLSLKENLENKIIIENPIMYVILKDHKDEYIILDPDVERHCSLEMLNSKEGVNFTPFHYFDAVSYVNDKSLSPSEQAARSISSSVAELKKFFSAGDSDVSDEETDTQKNCHTPKYKQRKCERSGLNIPNYEDLDSNLTSNTVESSEDEKIKKKKKLTPRQAKKLQVRQLEETRVRNILAKQKYLEQTKERVQLEWEINKAKTKVYMKEQEKRISDFQRSFARLSLIEESWSQFKSEKRKEDEWKKYLTCNKLPNPTALPEMNTFIFVWTELEKNASMPYSLKKTEEVMQLLHGLDEAIGDPPPDCPTNLLNGWKILRNEMRNLLQWQIDEATYKLFRRIETDMEAIDVTTSQHYCDSKYFSMHLWAELITPIPSSRAAEVRHPMKVSFNPASLTAVIPVTLLDVHKVIRVMLLNYDHWSDRCRSYDPPDPPPYCSKDLLRLAEEELDLRTEIISRREDLEVLMKKKIGNVPALPTLSQELIAWESEPQRALSEEVAFREGEEDELWKLEARMNLNENEVNLREREFLGGVIVFEILHQPPQPKYLRYKHDVTLLREPPTLQPVDYLIKYPPEKYSPTEGGNEDEHREAVEEAYDSLLEKEKQKLIHISLKLPSSVFWFEVPEAAQWSERENCWTSEYIHERSYDEEHEVMTFKTGSLGLIGLHVSRFCNLPYKDWRLESDGSGGVRFYLKAAKISLHFRIQSGEVSLESVEDFPEPPMPGMLNTFHTPIRLVQMLKGYGINVFPDSDAACYVPHISPKHVVCESYIYQIWGLFSSSFCFRHSKFNADRGRRQAVFQIKETYGSYISNFCLVRTSPIDACILDIMEDSDAYSPDPAQGSEVSTDVYNLLMSNCTSGAKRRADATDYVLVQTVRDLLGFIRPLSFS